MFRYIQNFSAKSQKFFVFLNYQKHLQELHYSSSTSYDFNKTFIVKVFQ